MGCRWILEKKITLTHLLILGPYMGGAGGSEPARGVKLGGGRKGVGPSVGASDWYVCVWNYVVQYVGYRSAAARDFAGVVCQRGAGFAVSAGGCMSGGAGGESRRS